MASISAHDTTPLHVLSTALFIESTTSNPLAELLLPRANFSVLLSPSNKTDASQPCEEGKRVKTVRSMYDG